MELRYGKQCSDACRGKTFIFDWTKCRRI